MRQKTCSACGGKMQSLGNMELQKGKFSMLFGHWDQILSGALDVDVECCERCKNSNFTCSATPKHRKQAASSKLPVPIAAICTTWTMPSVPTAADD